MADLDAQIRALEEQVAQEQQNLEKERQTRAAAAATGGQQTATPSAFGQPAQPAQQAAGPLFANPPAPPAQTAAATQAADPAQQHKKVFEKDADERSIYVMGLPKQNETPEQLAAFFQDCGPIAKCTILRDKATGQLKGGAYIEFQTHEAAGRAVDTKQNAVFQGSQLTISKKRSFFNPGSRGGRGRGRGGNPADMMANMMTMMMSAMGGSMARGRGRGGPGGRGGAGGPSGRGGRGGGYQPFQ